MKQLFCLGDSLTFGLGVRRQERWTTLTEQNTGIRVVNLGCNGDTTGGMLVRLQSQILSSHSASEPSAVLLMGGSNDISFEWEYRHAWSNIVAIYRQAKAFGLPMIIGLPVPMVPEDLMERPYYPGRDKFKIAALTEELARMLEYYCIEKEIPYVDFRTPFLGPDGFGRKELFFDGLHPTAEGHELMAQALCRTLAELP